MGGATRFVTLLTTPFPPLRPSLILLRHRFTSLSITPLRALTLSSLSKTKSHASYRVNSFHSQSNSNAYSFQSPTASQQDQQQHQHHPWPEWIHFLNILSNGQGWSTPNQEERRILPEDAFVVYEELPDDFVHAASTCLAFARARPDLLGLLSRMDIEAVVTNGTPFLFKSALECARRMRAFLESDGSHVSEFDKATTIDLMKYIISYASNPTISSSSEKIGLYSRELVDSSVRHLLHELGTVSCAPTGYIPASEHQFSDRSRQTTRPIGQNIEMKRGDWVCSKCNFMNFARNMKCLECEAPRPKKQLTGGEWECPQCNFFNYGRNSVCLRCDCRRPGVPLFNTINSRSSSGYNGDFSFKSNTDSRLAENEENSSQFSKITYQRTLSNYGNTKNRDSILGTPINHSLDGIIGRSYTDSERGDMGIAGEKDTGTEFSLPTSQSGSSDYQYTRDRNSNPTAFVPLPTDMFSRREQTAETQNRKEVPTKTQETVSSEVRDQTTPSSKSPSLGGNFPFPKNLSSRMDNDSKEKEQAEESEGWFKKIAELHDVKNHPSAISDEDFPEIMPIRMGENRFVVSKRKDRSLTSPKYKRQAVMDQATNSNFVPFVPFPPGYFARKETEKTDGLDSPVKATTDNASSKRTAVTEKSDGSRDVIARKSTVSIGDNEPVNSANSEFSRKYVADTRTLPTRDDQSMSSETSQFSGNIVGPPGSSPDERPITSSTIKNNNWTDGHSGNENVSRASSPGAFSQVSENESVRSSWTGKSLEGSAVKEPDPLDMSEEAKAERWFKRVAQIKDISELSQIPDEDFPSIMPMRKGVNRFVVSKRKTPLERRLTSQQYRRNLPIVSTDAVKKESDNS